MSGGTAIFSVLDVLFSMSVLPIPNSVISHLARITLNLGFNNELIRYGGQRSKVKIMLGTLENGNTHAMGI